LWGGSGFAGPPHTGCEPLEKVVLRLSPVKEAI
jgi:hypothetical protein